MLYEAHIPAAPLLGRVEYLWALRDAPAHARERILPSGTVELVVNLDDDEFRIYDRADPTRPRRFPGAIVSGAYRSYFVIDTREHASVIGVHFRPAGASALLGLPAGELADAHVALESLWGRSAVELADRLRAARGAVERFRLLEAALLARLPRADTGHRAVPLALAELERDGGHVREIAARLGLSHRRLIEVFRREIGMTPKRFARVRRFRRALAAMRGAPVDWAGLAAAHGYCDQSHLIRDVMAFSGFSPVDLRRRSERVKEHHAAL
jgi:AraC-like DNA-binding protein